MYGGLSVSRAVAQLNMVEADGITQEASLSPRSMGRRKSVGMSLAQGKLRVNPATMLAAPASMGGTGKENPNADNHVFSGGDSKGLKEVLDRLAQKAEQLEGVVTEMMVTESQVKNRVPSLESDNGTLGSRSPVNAVLQKKEPRQVTVATPWRTVEDDAKATHMQETSASQDDAFAQINHRLPNTHLPDSHFRIVWDLLYLSLLFFESTTFTLSLFSSNSSGEVVLPFTDGFKVFKVLTSCFWIADIWVQSTTCIVKGWEFIEGCKEVRKGYVLSYRFALDALGSIPVDAILLLQNEHTVASYFALLRMARLHRVPNLFQRRSPTSHITWWRELSFVMFVLGLIVHLLACLWLVIGDKDEQDLKKEAHEDFVVSYTNAVYFVITTLSSVGFGDITPSRTGSRIYSSVVSMCGSVIILIAGGRAGALFIVTDPVVLVEDERRRRLEALMNQNNIPWETRKEAFTVYPAILEASLHDYLGILNELPTSIQQRIKFHMKTAMLRKVPMFGSLPVHVTSALASRLRTMLCQPKEALIESGTIGDEMYFLNHGVVEVLIPVESDSHEVWTANLGEGSWFGEIALLHECRRVATVRTLTSCVLYKLKKPDFQEVMSWSNELRDALEVVTKQRMQELESAALDDD